MSTDDATAAEMRLASTEAIPLAYVLTARIAAHAGVRLLAIKGVVLSHHGLRAPRVSADVDVIVHPDDLETFVAAMEASGWRCPPEATAPKVMATHAVNLVNDHWPIGVDAHHRFPGFLAPAGEVFDEMWRRKVAIDQAGHQMWATDLSASAAVLALHHLRERDDPGNQQAFANLVEMAGSRMSATDLVDLADFSTAAGCTSTLGPLFTALGAAPGAQHPAEANGIAEWNWATTANRNEVWRHAWKQTEWWRRPAFLLRSFQPDEERLRELHFRDAETPLWRLRVARTQHVARRAAEMLRARRAR